MRSSFLLWLSMIGFADAWTTPSNPRSSLTVDVSRKTFVNGVVAGVIGSAILPLPVKADVTNKVAGSTALRNLKRAQKQLSKLESVAKENDFAGVKEFLRTPPFGESRKNAFTLVRAAEDGPRMADMGNVYKAFISSIEKIDSTASLGFRGRQIPQLQLTDEYLVVQSSLEAFLKVAEEAAEIPLQYDD